MSLLFVCYSVYAQNPSQIDVLTTDDGLPFRSITCMAQDKNQMMWFGTEVGLIRYDGNNFKVYNSDRTNPFYIENEQIGDNIEIDDTANILWFFANLKLYNLDLTTNKVTAFNGSHGIKGDVVNLLRTEDGSIWIKTEDYLTANKDEAKHYLQKLINDKFEVKATVSRIQSGNSTLTKDRKGHIILNLDQGSFKFNANGELLDTYKLSTFNWQGNISNFTLSYFDKNNKQYFFSQKEFGIFTLSEDGLSSKHILNNGVLFYQGIQDDEDQIWFSGDTDLFRMDTNGVFKDYTQQLRSTLEYSKINMLFIDANKLLWVATDNGLFKIRIEDGLFTSVFASKNQGWGNTMRGIFEDANGTIYVKSESQNKILFKTIAGKIDTLHLNLEKNALEISQYVSIFYALDENKKNAFTLGLGLMKINLETGATKIYDEFKSSIDLRSQNPIIKLRNGKLLFGQSLSQLILFDPETEAYSMPFENKNIENDFADFRFFKESKTDDVIWIGTRSDGLLKVNMNGGVETQFSKDTNPRISRNYILAVDEDLEGNIWIGTYGGGLNYLSADGKTIKTFTKNNGLPDNNVVGFLFDDNQNMWISTYNGLCYFNPTTEVFQNFYAEDGLTHFEFNYSSFYKDSNGNFYFGGMNGLNKFKPNEVLKQSETPNMRFTEFSGYNSKTKTDFKTDFNQTKLSTLEISPYDQYFEVNWTMPSYFQNNKNTYSTKLEGFENRWFYHGNSSSIRYNKLPAGDYVLNVKGKDSRGNESPSILSIPITVKQIFYKKWWFIALAILAVIAIMSSIFRYRFKQAMAMERLRTKISSDLHDDVGSLLSGLAMQTELMEINASEADKLKLQKIAGISRNAISQMRDLVWSIDSRRETVNDLIERMHELAEELLLPKDITFQIVSSSIRNPNRRLIAQTKQALFLIYKEAITNILRHSDATHVKIALTNTFKGCEFTIKDNGSKKESYKSTGLGLSNMVMRAEKLKGDIVFKRENGFCVELHLPFNM
ncbi:two-component system sensor with a ligand-binding domain protein [Winogradskyella psychrotolerans]|nr:two-component system sensor with a ligand-binding domain protein [Winogradskyella psychrotolerans]